MDDHGPDAALLDRCARALELADRPDAAQWIRTLLQREIDRVSVVVLGEVKRGKSSLLNALIGQPLLPVDADLATGTFIRVHHAPEVSARVILAGGETEAVSVVDLPRRVGVTGVDPNLPLAIGADVAAPITWIGGGSTAIDLIDTPGVGGVQSIHTRRAVESADQAGVVLFVVDAGQPISAAELAVLEKASQGNAPVVVAMTRIDAHPTRWRTVLEETRRQIQAAGVQIPVHPVSAQFAVRAAAAQEQAAALGQASGMAPLVADLESAAARAAVWPRRHAAETARSSLQDVVREWERERAALTGHSDDADLAARRAALAELTGQRERWTLDLQRDLARLKQQTTTRISRELDQIHHQWSATTKATDLRRVALDLESTLQLLADQIIQDFHQELVRLVQQLFATIHARDDDQTDVTQELFNVEAFVPDAPEAVATRTPRRRLPVVDPSVVSMAMLGAGLAPQFGAVLGIATGVGLFHPAGLVFGGALVAINVAFRSRRAGQQQIADMVADTTRRTRSDLLAWCDLVVTEVQPEIRVAYAERLQTTQAAVERELAAARRARAEDERHRRDAVAELDQKIEVCTTLLTQLGPGTFPDSAPSH